MNLPTNVSRTILFGIPLAAMFAMVLAAVFMAGDLPTEIPSHWSGTGLSDDSMPLGVFTGFLAVLAGVFGIGAAAVHGHAGPAVVQRGIAASGSGLAAFLAAIHVGSLLAARGTTGPIPFPTSTFVVATGLALMVGLLGALVVSPTDTQATAIAAEPITIIPGEAVVWTGGSRAAPGLLIVLGVVSLVGAGLAVSDIPWVAAVYIAVLFVAFTLTRVKLTIGPAGLTALVGPFGVVRFRAQLADITEVRAEEIDPVAYGGWGIRVLPGIRGIIMRKGPGLVVERGDNATLVITTDDAARAAGVLQAHLSANGVKA